MNINYTKLLPTQLRDTRWADILTVIGSILEDIKIAKIDIIKTQSQIMNMTDEQLINFASNFGYDITNLVGYTATIDYLRKEVYTIVPRILNRTTKSGYDCIFSIFNLIGNIYPTIYDGSTYLTVLEDWETSDESTIAYDTLDAGGDFILFRLPYLYDTYLITFDTGLFYDAYYNIYDNPATSSLINVELDNILWPTLDAGAILDNITRHIIIKYAFRYIENTTEFLSNDTLNAFYTDVLNQKRRTEVVYYEPIITINTNDDNTLTTDTWYNYDYSISTTQKSILIGTDLSDAKKIRFGNNAHTTVDLSITDVNQFIIEVLIANCDILLSSMIYLEGRRKITQKCTFPDFTEIAIWDSLNNCIYYATFPKIRYYSKMYANVAFNLSLI